MDRSIEARLAAFAASLREVGAIRSDAVARAFATVPRHRCVPRFRLGPETIIVPMDEPLGDEVLDIVYSHRSLVTGTGQQGEPPSSSSAPPLMARMLEALDLHPGMRVLEIGAGTGYNAALIAAVTGASVVTVEAGAGTARSALDAIHRLRLDRRVTVRHADGYLGDPSGAPYDRIVVTCGIAGISPHWLDQLAPGGLILAPVAHGGVHPILSVRPNEAIQITAALWADFMPASGPLRPAELVGHDPADYLPGASVVRIPGAMPELTATSYNNLWFFLATRDRRITRAYTDDDTVDPAKGACALHDVGAGTAWVQTDGCISLIGDRTIADELRALARSWQDLGEPVLTRFVARLKPTGTDEAVLWTSGHWELASEPAVKARKP